MQFKQIIITSVFWRGLYFFTVLLLNIVLAQFFGSAITGGIYYLTNLLSLVLLLAGLSLESGMGFFASQKKISEARLATLALAWSLLIVSITIIVLYSNSSFARISQFSYKEFAFMSATYIAGLLMANFFNALFYAQGNYFLPNAVMSICNLLIIIIGISLHISPGGEAYLDIFLKIYFLGFIIQGLLLAGFYFWKNKLIGRLVFPGKKELRLLLRYSIFALAGNLIYFLLYRIDYWFIQHTCVAYTKEELGVYLGNYIQVSKIGQLLLVLPSILASAVFPSTAAGFKEQVHLRLPSLIKSLVIIYLVLILLLAVSGNWLFPWLYGPTYNHMYIPFLLCMPGIVSLSVISLISAYNSGNNKIYINIIGAFIGLLLMIAGDLLFIPKYGIIGAALVSTVSYISYLLYILYVFKKEHNVQLRNLIIPGREDWNALRNIILLSWK
jgi:O-antigen/teichoic acid export membrane protein